MSQFSPSLGGVGWVSLRIMEKKEYVIPTCEVVELEGTVYMQAGSIDVTPGEGDDFELQGNRHRGEWGNLWNR